MTHDIEGLKAEIRQLRAELAATQTFAAISAVLANPSGVHDPQALGLSLPAEHAEHFLDTLRNISRMARTVEAAAQSKAA